MATVTLKGTECHTNGELPNIGDIAPSIKLTDGDLAEVTLDNFANKKKLLNIVPSLDTDVCQISTKKFNEYAAGKDDIAIIAISADLPFAQSRFCNAEKLSHVRLWCAPRRWTTRRYRRTRRCGIRCQQ